MVDDGSSDGTFDLVKSFCSKDSRIKLHQRDRHPKGANTCRNIALSKVKGQYFMFLDSDDKLAKFCLEKRIITARNSPQYDAWVFPSTFFRDSQVLNKIFYHEDSLSHPELAFLLRPQWAMNGSFFNTKKFRKYDISFDENIPFWQDWAFHIDVLLHGLSFERNGKSEPDVYIRHHNNPSRITNCRGIDPKKIDAIYQCLFSIHKSLLQQDIFDNSYFIYRMHYLFEYLIHRGNKKQLNQGFNYLEKQNLNFFKIYNVIDNATRFLIKTPIWDKALAHIYFLANQKVLNNQLESLKTISSI